MTYTSQDIEYIERFVSDTSTEHLKKLADMVKAGDTLENIFNYGRQFLPKIFDKKTGLGDLARLEGYTPVIVQYFDVLSELPSLSKNLKDLAADLAIYANGESVQLDSSYLNLDPEAELKKALSTYNT